MPSQKTRSKEDTWTTDELNKALGKSTDRRRHRDRDEERKRDRVNGEERRRHRDEDSDHRRSRHKDDDGGADVRLTEEERERQREERRRRKEGKDGSSSKDRKGKEIQFRGKSDHKDIELNDVNDVDSDERHRRHHSDRDRERQHRDDDREKRHRDDDRERRHRDDDRERQHRDDADRERHQRHRDDEDDQEKRRRHRDEDDRERRRKHEDDDKEERERRRLERRREREEREEEERRRRHEEKKDRRKDEDRKKDRDRDEDRHRDRKDRDRRHETEEERQERKEREREERRKEREERKDRDRPRETEQKKEERREREREERRREREERHRDKDDKKSSKRKEEEKKEEEDDEYNYEEDFEDYEEDFEDEDEEEEPGPSGRGRNIQDSEVNEVLRALDAENERLLSSASKSPQPSWRRQEDSDRDQNSDDEYDQTYKPRAERPRTAINFVSAKQRAVNRKTAGKTMQRGKDLLRMIELDVASFDIMDMPPVNEYDLYIRAFGSSNTRQAYVQTNDDNVDRDIQTEEIDARSKWTQHPPEDFRGYGRGDGEKDMEEEEESQSKQNREQDMGRLNKFLEKAGQVIAILLEEGKDEEAGSQRKSRANISVSEGYTQLDILPLLQGRHVTFSHFSPGQPNLLLTIYSDSPQVAEENPVSKRGVICVWNTNEPTYPQKILVCSSQPRCCCFSPIKPYLVFAGMVDGSIAMWDLREPSSAHQFMVLNEESWSLRYPTYDTASVLKEENHHSPVISIQPIYSYVDVSKSENQQSQASEDTSSGLSFQLVSTEESAVLNFWVVAEIGRPELAGSESDLGLAPGAAVKLLKSSTLTLDNPSKDLRSQSQSGLRVLDMALMPNDPNHFYVATDGGSVLHGIRFGKRTFPRAHTPPIESVVNVVSIDFSPFDQPCFLAGCADGTFSLYHTKSEHPVMSWPHITKGQSVQCVRWSRSRPCVFYVLDAASTLYVFDLLEGDILPKSMESVAKEKVTSFSLTADQRPDGLGPSGKDAQMLFSFDDGRTEIHTINKSLRVAEQLEPDYLGSYLHRF